MDFTGAAQGFTYSSKANVVTDFHVLHDMSGLVFSMSKAVNRMDPSMSFDETLNSYVNCTKYRNLQMDRDIIIDQGAIGDAIRQIIREEYQYPGSIEIKFYVKDDYTLHVQVCLYNH